MFFDDLPLCLTSVATHVDNFFLVGKRRDLCVGDPLSKLRKLCARVHNRLSVMTSINVCRCGACAVSVCMHDSHRVSGRRTPKSSWGAATRRAFICRRHSPKWAVALAECSGGV